MVVSIAACAYTLVRGYIFRPLCMLVVTRRALMPEVVGFIQLALCPDPRHGRGLVMGWSGF
jgi:hypothetical protein